MRFVPILCLVSLALAVNAEDPIPVVMWHGMGDNCCSPYSMGRIQKLIEKEIPGVYVNSLRIGRTNIQDSYNSFLLDVNKQVEMVCDELSKDEAILKAGKYNAVGFSQGSQFLRAVAQRCPTPAMNNLISIGGQQEGVYGLPKCPGAEVQLCDYVREMLNMGAYLPFVQNNIVQAQYWHDPTDEDLYRAKSVFLADINQENEVNEEYKNNFMKLNNFVMVKFLKDSMVQPRESQWFGFYVPGQAKDVHNYTQTRLYKEDRLGLQSLDKSGKVHFLSVDGDHLQFSDEWFIDEIVNKYFK